MNRNTEIIYKGHSKPILNAIRILKRDMDAVLMPTEENGGTIILLDAKMPEEQFEIQNGTIYAGDDLGFIYALLHISEVTLHIPPFWFWYDYQMPCFEDVEIENYVSKPARIRFRGWFLNDEILLSHWSPDDDPMTPWHMAFEALLRCGGNMVLPTTQVSRGHYVLAAEYGLWLTHHHAEPLGADMFAKAYPNEDPSYFLQEDKYKKLWADGIEFQKNYKVVWDIGFRGQGDMPFWKCGNGLKYDTDEKRGGLISNIIKYQYDLLHEKVENPVCCTYIYGETADLYKKGFIEIPKDVIKIWSDNGYGKMVSRRMGLDNPRIPALPDDKNCKNGIYYHVSYCDLQSCAHITQIGNRIEFLEDELLNAFEHGADEYLLVNCSNVRPHVFPLAMIAKLWNGESFSKEEFCNTYIGTADAVAAFDDYAEKAVNFGEYEDEHAGDHFYNFTTRAIASCIMKNRDTVPDMVWATGKKSIQMQLDWFEDKCRTGITNYDEFLKKHDEKYGRLYESTIILYAKLHYFGYNGGYLFVRGCKCFFDKNYIKAFYMIGLAADEFEKANTIMRQSEYGRWKGYYANECFADFKFTAYLLRVMMTFVRNFGEGAGFWEWQRKLFYPENAKGVRLQLNLDNRDTSEEMFEKMKKSSLLSKQYGEQK